MMKLRAIASVNVLAVLMTGACSWGPPAGNAVLRAGGVVYPSDEAGLFERLRAGNIDEAGSQAFNRWGPGYLAGIAASDRKFEKASAGP